MNFAFVQMSFNVNGVSVVDKSDIVFTTHVFNSAVYFLCFCTDKRDALVIRQLVMYSFLSHLSEQALNGD